MEKKLSRSHKKVYNDKVVFNKNTEHHKKGGENERN